MVFLRVPPPGTKMSSSGKDWQQFVIMHGSTAIIPHAIIDIFLIVEKSGWIAEKNTEPP